RAGCAPTWAGRRPRVPSSKAPTRSCGSRRAPTAGRRAGSSAIENGSRGEERRRPADNRGMLHVIHVQVRVLPEAVDSFRGATLGRIVFGPGRVTELGGIARELGLARVMLVTGRTPGRAAAALDSLRGAGVETVLFHVSGEPTVVLAQSGAAAARRMHAEA